MSNTVPLPHKHDFYKVDVIAAERNKAYLVRRCACGVSQSFMEGTPNAMHQIYAMLTDGQAVVS